MARTTIKQAIADALESLSSECFSKFTFCLLDRREKPFIRRRSVENKNIFELTDALVSNFGEVKALEVTLDLLKRINCNQEAERLESETRIFFDNGDPILRKTSTGELETKASQEAQDYAEAQRPLGPAQDIAPLMAKEVEAEAKALVLSEGGDPSKERLVLSRFAIQFGMYRGKTFKWLLENDSGWSVYLVKSHLGEIKEGKMPDSRTANKEFFTRYVKAIPEVWKKVIVADENAPLGFGKYKSETPRSLYESRDPDKIRHVAYLRRMSSTCTPGSKMEAVIEYIRQRDKKRGSASTRASRLKRKVLKGSQKTNRHLRY